MIYIKNNKIKVKVFNKKDLDKYIEDKHENNSIVITITNRGREQITINKNKRNKIINDICLQFNIITPASPCYGAIRDKEINDFISFIKKNIKEENNIKRIIVSSEYGIIGALYIAIVIMNYLNLEEQLEKLLENETYRLYFKKSNYNYIKLTKAFDKEKEKK